MNSIIHSIIQLVTVTLSYFSSSRGMLTLTKSTPHSHIFSTGTELGTYGTHCLLTPTGNHHYIMLWGHTVKGSFKFLQDQNNSSLKKKQNRRLREKVGFVLPTGFWNHIESTILCVEFVKHRLGGSRKMDTKQSWAEKSSKPVQHCYNNPTANEDRTGMKWRSRKYLFTTKTFLSFPTDKNMLQNYFLRVFVVPFAPTLRPHLYSVWQ